MLKSVFNCSYFSVGFIILFFYQTSVLLPMGIIDKKSHPSWVKTKQDLRFFNFLKTVDCLSGDSTLTVDDFYSSLTCDDDILIVAKRMSSDTKEIILEKIIRAKNSKTIKFKPVIFRKKLVNISDDEIIRRQFIIIDFFSTFYNSKYNKIAKLIIQFVENEIFIEKEEERRFNKKMLRFLLNLFLNIDFFTYENSLIDIEYPSWISEDNEKYFHSFLCHLDLSNGFSQLNPEKLYWELKNENSLDLVPLIPRNRVKLDYDLFCDVVSKIEKREVKRKKRKAMLLFHPDKFPSSEYKKVAGILTAFLNGDFIKNKGWDTKKRLLVLFALI